MTIVTLKPGKERKTLNGYPWVFRDETDKIEGEKISGEICTVFSKDYKFLGKGFYSSSNIAVRMLTNFDEPIDKNFFLKKVNNAIEIRKDIFDSCRLIHGEADGIPGLIVDKYHGYLVMQIRNNGLESVKHFIIDALAEAVKPAGIYERSDFETNTGETLKRNVGTVYGEEPPESLLIDEHNIKYNVDLKRGQKTGFFFDQRESREYIRSITKKGDLVLDAYTYTGGFAMNMALNASKVIAVDKDYDSVEMAKKNAELNNLNNIEFYNSRYEDFIANYTGEKFDIIVLDPPSLIKKKEERRKGVEIFQNITKISIPHLKENGIIGVCSCAYEADIDLLVEATRKAFEGMNKKLQVLGVTYQSHDHPWVIQIPESLYLKCLWLKVR